MDEILHNPWAEDDIIEEQDNELQMEQDEQSMVQEAAVLQSSLDAPEKVVEVAEALSPELIVQEVDESFVFQVPLTKNLEPLAQVGHVNNLNAQVQQQEHEFEDITIQPEVDEDFQEFQTAENSLEALNADDPKYTVVELIGMKQLLDDQQRIAFTALVYCVLHEMAWRYARFEYIAVENATTRSKSNLSQRNSLNEDERTLIEQQDECTNAVRQPFDEMFYSEFNVKDFVFLDTSSMDQNQALCFAVKEFQQWGDSLYKLVCESLDITPQEQEFIESSAKFVQPQDLTKCLVPSQNDGTLAVTDIQRRVNKEDKRPHLLWNFLLLIMANDQARTDMQQYDNFETQGSFLFDSRSRALLRMISVNYLNIHNWLDIIEYIEGPLVDSHLLASNSDDSLDDLYGVPSLSVAAATRNRQRARTKSDANKRTLKERRRRLALMSAAAIGGGAIIGLSAGLAAPILAAGLGSALAAMNVAGATAFFGGAGVTAAITTGATVYGTSYGAHKMEKRTREVEVFKLLPIQDSKTSNIGAARRVNMIISIAGWVFNKRKQKYVKGIQSSLEEGNEDLDIGLEDLVVPFIGTSAIMGAHYALCFDPHILSQLGDALKMFASELISFSAQQILQQTLLSTLMSGLTWPLWLLKLSYLVDNPWSLGLDRAHKAGYLLADQLCNNPLVAGRPVTLVGYSLGARVIFYCLVELAKRGKFGLIEDVYLFGCPVLIPHVTVDRKAYQDVDQHLGVPVSSLKPNVSPNATSAFEDWRLALSAVGGRLHNCFNRSDWVLAFLLRASCAGLYEVAGLTPVLLDEKSSPDVTVLYPDNGQRPYNKEETLHREKEELLPYQNTQILKNVDVTNIVTGHLQYRTMMPQLMRRVAGFAQWSEDVVLLKEVVSGDWMTQIDGWWKAEEERLGDAVKVGPVRLKEDE